jgi:hypothetical protein
MTPHTSSIRIGKISMEASEAIFHEGTNQFYTHEAADYRLTNLLLNHFRLLSMKALEYSLQRNAKKKRILLVYESNSESNLRLS